MSTIFTYIKTSFPQDETTKWSPIFSVEYRGIEQSQLYVGLHRQLDKRKRAFIEFFLDWCTNEECKVAALALSFAADRLPRFFNSVCFAPVHRYNTTVRR